MANAPEGLNQVILRKVRRFDTFWLKTIVCLPKQSLVCQKARFLCQNVRFFIANAKSFTTQISFQWQPRAEYPSNAKHVR